jgi:uncharacterized protein YjbI with pentapeptide repeats
MAKDHTEPRCARAELLWRRYEKGERFFDGIDLENLDLQDAALEGASLRGANLAKSNLIGANLRSTALDHAELRDARLWHADLSYSQLVSVRHLIAGQLAGSDLTGAVVEELNMSAALKDAEIASTTCSSAVLSMLLVCAYAALTVATTTDWGLLTNPSSWPLPIIGTPVSLVGFYTVAPLLLVAIFVYLHLALQRLWSVLANLPAVLPDGRTVDRAVSTWFLSGIVRSSLPLLAARQHPLAIPEKLASLVLCWFLVPLTLFVMWGRYLTAHDSWVSGLHVGLLGFVGGFGVYSHRIATKTLLHEQLTGAARKPAFGGLLAGLVLATVSWGVIDGIPDVAVRYVLPDPSGPGDISLPGRFFMSKPCDTPLSSFGCAVRTFAPVVCSRLGCRPFEVVDDANWPQVLAGRRQAPSSPLAFQQRNLRFAEAHLARLEKADFRGADLQGVDLSKANLAGARFGRLEILKEGRFHTIAEPANLSAAILYRAHLEGADMRGADLSGADLRQAYLKDVKLGGTRLEGTDLRGAQGLDCAAIRQAKYWQCAFYDTCPVDGGTSLSLPPTRKSIMECVEAIDADQ